jgi:hypothetical protein
MISSALISKKHQIEREPKRGVRDPQKKAYLIARLLQIENDIKSLGFSEQEIESNDVACGKANHPIARQYYLPPSEWTFGKK